jgi:hypothetical protein
MQTLFKKIHHCSVHQYIACAIISLLSFSISSCDDDEVAKSTITYLSPLEAEPGEEVTINGTNLAETSEVKFNGTVAIISSKTATTVVTTVPSGATSGKVSIKTPGGEVSTATDFIVLPVSSTITSFSPESGEVGTVVTITGTNMQNVTVVKFNGATATITSKNETTIVTSVPEGATTGKITITGLAGDVSSAGNFSVGIPPQQVMISDFEEENANELWSKAEDAGDVSISAIETEGDNSFFHLQAIDNNGNYWVGGRYFEENIDTPLGIEESDLAAVWMNVDVKSNNAMSIGKLVYAVKEEGAPDGRRNYERDFDVDWSEWKTVSIRVDKFGYWDGFGMVDAVTGGADIPTIWSVALYVRGGNSTASYDLSYDNLRFSIGVPLGEDIEGHH